MCTNSRCCFFCLLFLIGSSIWAGIYLSYKYVDKFQRGAFFHSFLFNHFFFLCWVFCLTNYNHCFSLLPFLLLFLSKPSFIVGAKLRWLIQLSEHFKYPFFFITLSHYFQFSLIMFFDMSLRKSSSWNWSAKFGF